MVAANSMPFLKVLRWRIQRLGGPLGFGPCSDRVWRWVAAVRLWLSYHLGIGNWFRSSEECERCGAPAGDIDFMVERVAAKRIRCIDRGACDDTATENARYA